jgi:TonB family protein
MADIYNGEVLYRIPKRMKLGAESECIIRLSFDRKKLLHDFEVQVGDVMKDLRISDVMGVELLDPNADKAFSITTLNDTVQFMEKDLVTEWIFCVTPLKQGQYPLVLKISIIEIINGIERKRNEVLKEHVEILAEINESTPEFVSAGYTWQVTDSDEQRAVPGAGKGVEPQAPTAPSPAMPSTQPSNTTKALGLGLIGKVIAGVATAVVAVVGINHLVNSDSTGPSDAIEVVDNSSAGKLKRLRKNPSRLDLEHFIQENPAAPEVQMAIMLMDSLETATWNTALASNDRTAMEQYLREYPEGKYLDDATQRIWDLDSQMEAIKDAPELKPGIDSIVKITPETGGEIKNTKPRAPVSPSRPNSNVAKPKPKPTDTNPKPPTKPNTGTKPSKTEPEKPKDKVKPVPVDPNRPVTPSATARKPLYKGCERKKGKEAETCTVNRIQGFLQKNLSYPPDAFEKKLKGTVNVSFVIERDGSITDVHATNDIGGGCAAAAVKAVKKLPKFKPGLNAKGEPVRVLFNQPVRFSLDGK